MLPPFLGEDYDAITASNAREALDHLSRGGFDIVVSDLTMPEISGVELLARVAEISPSTARVVVSGFADEITVAKCLMAGHRYFSKPFDPIALTTMLQSLVRAREISGRAGIRKLVGRLDTLPTPSETYLGLMKALNAQDKSIQDIAVFLEGDPSLAAKILQAVNSAMFGMSRRIVSLTEAVQILGLQVLRALVLTIQVFDFYQKPSLKSELQKVWRHSADVAHLARKICDERKWSSEISEEAFLAALLHDIGRIILSATPPETRTQLFPEYQLHNEGMQCPVSQAIEAEAGGYLLALWGVPDPIITAVRTYHTLSDGMGESSGVALAIAHQLHLSLHPTGNAPAPTPTVQPCKSILIISNDPALTDPLVEQCRKTNRFHMIAGSPLEAFQTFHDLQFDLALVDPHIFPFPAEQVEGHLRQVNATTPIRLLGPHHSPIEEIAEIMVPIPSSPPAQLSA